MRIQRRFDRDEALRTASDVFSAEGFAGARTAGIAASMNIGPESARLAFGSKRDLYVECLRTYDDRLVQKQLDALRDAPDFLEGVRLLIERSFDASTPSPGSNSLAVGSIVEFGIEDEEISTHRQVVMAQLRSALIQRVREARIEGAIREDLLPEAVAEIVQATIYGMHVMLRAGAEIGSVRAVASFVVESFRPIENS